MAAISFENFDLLIEPTLVKPHYCARVLSSPVGQAEVIFTLPFSDQDIENFQQTLQKSGTDHIHLVEEWGKKLFTTVFQNDVLTCLRRSLDATHTASSGLRIRLRLGSDRLLSSLDWEYLYDPLNGHYLAQSRLTPIVRFPELPQRIQPLAIPYPLRLLVADVKASSSKRRLSNVRRAIQKNFTNSPASSHILLSELDLITLVQLQLKLREEQYHVLHLIGENTLYAQAQGVRLGTLLHDHPSLRLVILSTNLDKQTGDITISEVAERLMRQGIPAVIAMQRTPSEAALIHFINGFYGALADDYPVDAALAEARKSMLFSGSDFDWAIPALYLCSAHSSLFYFSAHTQSSSHSASSSQQTTVNVQIVNTEGGAYVAGDVTLEQGDFVGRDKTSQPPDKPISSTQQASLQLSQGDVESTQPKVEPHPQPERILYRWPVLWQSDRPAENPAIEEWLRISDLKLNPFGPDSSELDPYLEQHYVYPAIFEARLRGARSAVVFGASGSGKTAAALLLTRDCTMPTLNPRERNAFPFYLSVSDEAISTKRENTVTHLLAEMITEAFIPFLVVNTYIFLTGTPEEQLAIATTLLYGAGSVENLINQLYLTGLPEEGAGRRFLAELQSRIASTVNSHYTEGRWLDIFAKVHPRNYRNSYLILDVTKQVNASVDPATLSRHIQPLINLITPLGSKGIYLKLFLPEELESYLVVPAAIKGSLLWSSEDLVNLLTSRINYASSRIRDFRQFFDRESKLPDPIERLVSASQGSPQRLIRLGNRLLQEHVSQRPIAAELNYCSLEAALAAADLDE